MAMKCFICEVVELVLCEYFLVAKREEYTCCYHDELGLSCWLGLSFQRFVTVMAVLVLPVL